MASQQLNPPPDDYDVLVSGGTTGQSVVLFIPASLEAYAWFEEHLKPEPWQRFGAAIAIDHRPAADVFKAIEAAGFRIRLQ